MTRAPLTAALLSKIDEQIERTNHLISLLPPDCVSAAPPLHNAWTAERLLGHLLDCLAGFCAVLQAVEPERLAHFSCLRHLSVNHACSPSEARSRIAVYRSHIREGFALLTDDALARSLRTVFVPDGEPLVTLLLGNLEHLINHKHQLFIWLQHFRVPVSTRDLYRFRGEPAV
jgi:hypothetical protein